jgi:hypothetical protein
MAYLTANIGKPDGVSPLYAAYVKQIVASWPDFLKACKAKGVPTTPDHVLRQL